MRKLCLVLTYMAYIAILFFGCSDNNEPSTGNPNSSSSSSSNNSTDAGNSSSSLNETIPEVCFGEDFSEPSTPSGGSEAPNTGTCIPPPGHVSPPNGKETCIIVKGKCYKCNPERGDACLNEWLWTGQQVEQEYWWTDVTATVCSGSGGSANLICSGFSSAAYVGATVTHPTVKCGSNAITAGITWSPTELNWANPVMGCYNVTVKATTGDCSGKTASCGKLTVSPAPTLTCGTLPETAGIVGQTISSPTVKCGTTDVPFSNITWVNAPAWDNPTAIATYSDIRATVKSGDCKDKQAACSGTLAVSAAPADQLTCASVTQTVTLPATPSAPQVKCGNTILTSGITWKHSTSTTFNWNSLAAGSYSNINATATCGSGSKTASCVGSVVVLNAAPSSSSGGGNEQSYPPLQQGQSGVQKGWASRYWDACKQSCSWGGKTQNAPLTSSDRCKACQKDGSTEIAANDNNKSSCDGGNSYTCFDFTPYKVNDNLAYGFAASPTDRCGKCFQLQFDGGFKHGTANATHQAIKGKTLIVMTSNMGGDVGEGQFDVLIPGGGVGAFDAFSSQINVSKAQLGKQYGGLLSTCEEENNYEFSKYKQCLTTKCNIFTNATLKEGCLFYANWFEAANNPTMLYKEVDCPQYLINKYKATLK